MGYVREYREGDAESLAPRLRQADLQELRASTHVPPAIALRKGAECSAPSLAIIGEENQVEGLFGIFKEPDGTGTVWMMGSDALTKSPLKKQFLRECRTHLAHLTAGYRLVGNCVDARNTVHINWLKWMGFTFIRRNEFYGVEQRPFLEFIKLCAWVVDSNKVEVDKPQPVEQQ